MEKQDVARLRKDVPKYYAAGVLTSEENHQWESRLDVIESKYGSLPEVEPEWVIDSLTPVSSTQVG